ncbi:MAG: HAD-IIA family hydrolase [Chthonomonas sp.]|nr:HAD-IIA family hydrolase [Chthonomonas sp.]
MKLLVFDLDGTLYRGATPLPGAIETIAKLRERYKIRFLTNNSALTRPMIANRLAGMGFQATPEECYGTADGVAARLRELKLRSALVVGEPGLHQAVRAAGVTLDDFQPDAIVVGICRTFSYELMDAAARAIRAGARFLATNTDATYPIEDGQQQPGAGAIVASIAVVSGQEPEVIGKPEPTLIHQILREAGVDPADALVIGDRVETDIVAGERAGCPTWLVLTGVTSTPPPGQDYGHSLLDLLARL